MSAIRIRGCTVSMHSFGYFIKEALSNFKRNFGTTFGAIVTIFLSLLVIGAVWVASLVVDNIVQGVEDQVSISIFLSDDHASETDQGTAALESYIKSLPDVASVTFKSKDQALQDFKNTSSSDIADQLDGNPLPASLEVELSDPEQVQSVVDQIMAQPTYGAVIDNPSNPSDSIRYGQQIVNQLFAVAGVIRIVCLVLVLMLIFVALIFINNTIRLAIMARRREIAIMRLVGASNGFIRGPFLMEGAIQAIIGAALAIACIFTLTTNLLPQMASFLSFITIDYASIQAWYVYLALLGIGVVIGLFGSFLAMRRYLKI